MFKLPPSNKTLFLFTQQLATLLNAGVPLLQALTILEKQESRSYFKKIILQLIATISSGNSLSEALGLHPKIFSKLYMNMVKAGEEGGIIGIVLYRLTELQEKSLKVKNKISSLLVYPTLISIITIIIMGFLLAFVIPKFEITFAEMLHEKQLPFLTQFVIGMSRGLRTYLVQIVTAFFLSLVAFKIVLQTERVKETFDKFILKIPLFGPLTKKSSIALFTRTLGTLIENGVSMLQALRITEQTANNSLISHAISKIHDGVEQGDSIINTMERNSLFPPMVTSMIAVGEETAQLAQMLLGIATVYENEVDNEITRLLAMIEPLMILLLAIIVGTIVIALFLPLVTMMGEFSME